MKRFPLTSVALLAAATLVAGVATAGDTKGPPCANITGNEQTDFYRTSASPHLQWTFVLGAPSCESVNYVLRIYSFDGVTPLHTLIQAGTGAGDVTFSYTFSGTPPSDGVCLVGETTRKGKTADRAPDGTACFQVAAGSSGAGGGFN